MTIKPTPTQEELDAASMGDHVHVKDGDGSQLDLAANPPQEEGAPEAGHPEGAEKKKQMEAKPGAVYSTRQATPQQTRAVPRHPEPGTD